MRISTKVRDQILDRDGHACVICGRTGPLELSHLIPFSQGGLDTADNLVTVCANCNRSLDVRIRYSDFENVLLELLGAHPDFRNVRSHAVVPLANGSSREIDIVAERRSGTIWEPLRIECKLGGLTQPRLDEVREQLQSIKSGRTIVVLALSTDLPEEHVLRLTSSGVEVWTLSQIAERFGQYLAPARRSLIASQIRTRIQPDAKPKPEDRILSDLKACARGKASWSHYQQLVGRLLNHLFCPPLQQPAAESADASGENRRDFVFPNYAEAGFWCFLRQQYHADRIVVDAKNYGKGVGKRDVLQVTHYLKPYGVGLFAIIVSRTTPSSAAYSAAREAWISQHKLVLFLDDNDVESMVLAKGAGDDASLLIRQKLEDFRLSM